MIEGTEFIDLTLGGGGSGGGGGSSASSEWIAKDKTIFAYPTTLSSSTTVDISDYLPEGATGQYEVLACGGQSSGNIVINTGVINEYAGMDGSTKIRSEFVLVIDADNPTFKVDVYTTCTYLGLDFKAYRKVTGVGDSGTFNYNDLMNKPKINNVNLKGNKSSSDLGLQDALVSGTNIKTINSTSLLGSGDLTVQETLVSGTNIKTINSTSLLGSGDISITSDVTDVQFNGVSVVTSGVANITSSNIRSVAPACTTITASDTTATLVANTTYAHAVSSSGCTYTLTTPSSTDVYSGFILMIDTTNSASIAFQTDGSPATSIVLNGNPTIATGKKYTVTGQYDVINSAWQLFIIDYSAS